MSLNFSASGAYYAEYASSFGSTTANFTFTYQFLSSSVATNQGMFGLVDNDLVANGEIGLFCNGTNLYPSTDNGNGTTFGFLPSTTTWYMFAARRYSGLNSSKYRVSVWNGSTWTHFDATGGTSAHNITRASFGFKTGDTLPRSTSVAGAKIAYARLWLNTYLDDNELNTERVYRTPQKAGCTAHWKFTADANDSIGSANMTLGGTTPPTVDSTEPPGMSDTPAPALMGQAVF